MPGVGRLDSTAYVSLKRYHDRFCRETVIDIALTRRKLNRVETKTARRGSDEACPDRHTASAANDWDSFEGNLFTSLRYERGMVIKCF